MKSDKLQENLMKSLQNKLKKESFVNGRYAEDEYSEQIDNVLKNYPKEFKNLDNGQCFKYKDLYVELRPETTTDENNVPEMDFAIFETEEDMNTDYEQNIGTSYSDITDAKNYWNYIKQYCDSILSKKLTEDEEDYPDMTWILEEYDFDVDVVTKEQLGSDYFYRTLCTSVNDAEKFNYHSDYWGDADTYQEENIDLMSQVEPYVGKEVIVNYEDSSVVFKILGILIDKQYNSISHTSILGEEVKEIVEESKKELKKEKLNLASGDGIFELKINTSNMEGEDVEEIVKQILKQNISNLTYTDLGDITYKNEKVGEYCFGYEGVIQLENKKLKKENKYYAIDCSDDDLYGSESNTEAFEKLQSIAKYFVDYAKIVDSDPMRYQIEDSDKLKEIANDLLDVTNKIEDYWSSIQ